MCVCVCVSNQPSVCVYLSGVFVYIRVRYFINIFAPACMTGLSGSNGSTYNISILSKIKFPINCPRFFCHSQVHDGDVHTKKGN